jgi:hypothetical protein
MPNPAAPFSTVNGYGNPSPSLVTDPASGLTSSLVDTADGFSTLHPSLNANGSLSPFVIDPVPISPAVGMPEINAVLVEARVISQLLHIQLGTLAPDLQIMRADEAWNTSFPSTTAAVSAPNSAGAM